MNRFILPIVLLFTVSFSSCLFQRRKPLIPIPDTEFPDFALPVEMGDILESQNGAGAGNLPSWLRAYITGGTDEAEKIEIFGDRYLFVGISEGLNFTAMAKWAENFSPVRDTAMFAAKRIEQRLISSASLYPDDEYGSFFESIVKKAYSAAYPGAVKEDTHWIKIRADNEESFLYIFYVLISIDKALLQNTVNEMINASIPTSSSANAALSQNQRSAINRLRDNFFEGF